MTQQVKERQKSRNILTDACSGPSNRSLIPPGNNMLLS